MKPIENLDELKKFVDNKDKILAEETMEHNSESEDTIPYWQGNLHKITDIIIENAGRFALSHASDILITLDSFFEEIKHRNIEQTCFTFAIRQSGVDGNELFIARSQSERDIALYRKVLFIEITKDVHPIDSSEILKIRLKEW